MLTAEQNERLTQTSAGTPMGNLLRQYWHPIAATAQLEKSPVMSVRILGEDLTLFRARNGTLGLVGKRCAHRLVDLKYGFPSPHHDDAIVCPYHGWAYSRTGKCIDQPMEPEGSTFKDKVQIDGYHARELAGMIFAYLGPSPVPELPAWEPMVMADTLRYIEYGTVPCNWVQLQENSPDRKHTQWLHGHFSKWTLNRRGVGEDDPQYQSTMRFVDFPTDEFFMEPFEYGHIRRNTIKGSDKNEGSYTVGTPLIFPNMNITASGARFTMIWRTPVDDVTTMSWFLYGVYPGEGVEIPPQKAIETVEIPTYDKDGNLNDHLTAVQDHIACFAQGAILDRTKERLGATDHDIIVWRKTVMEQLALLEAGGTPMNIFHDPEMGKFIKVPLICKDDPNRFGAWSLTADRKYQKRSATVNYSVPELPIVDEMEAAAEKGAAAWTKRRFAEYEAGE
jgi:5,5'-dehydrodivanillate O-demethylase